MNVKHKEEDNKGAFYTEKEGERMAEMTYSKAGDSMIIIDHTSVDDSLRGMGVGQKLVLSAVEFARDRKIKIMPLCPYARSVFDKNEEIRDILN